MELYKTRSINIIAAIFFKDFINSTKMLGRYFHPPLYLSHHKKKDIKCFKYVMFLSVIHNTINSFFQRSNSKLLSFYANLQKYYTIFILPTNQQTRSKKKTFSFPPQYRAEVLAFHRLASFGLQRSNSVSMCVRALSNVEIQGNCCQFWSRQPF